jgi:hypothetical protein
LITKKRIIHAAEIYHTDRATLKEFTARSNAMSWLISKVKGYELK